MNRRSRLIWVTVLTVATLLLGGGAMSAFAAGHGGSATGSGNQHTGQGQADHAASVTTHGQDSHDTGSSATMSHGQDSHDTGQSATTSHGQDSHDTVQSAPATTDDNSGNNADTADNGQGDGNDMVSPPGRVSSEERPGLGCGDDNHIHTGAPGNPDVHCKG